MFCVYEDMYVNECINRNSGAASLPTSPVKASAVLPTTTKEKPENMFEPYCPCTLQGHHCENLACMKIKVCAVCIAVLVSYAGR